MEDTELQKGMKEELLQIGMKEGLQRLLDDTISAIDEIVEKWEGLAELPEKERKLRLPWGEKDISSLFEEYRQISGGIVPSEMIEGCHLQRIPTPSYMPAYNIIDIKHFFKAITEAFTNSLIKAGTEGLRKGETFIVFFEKYHHGSKTIENIFAPVGKMRHSDNDVIYKDGYLHEWDKPEGSLLYLAMHYGQLSDKKEKEITMAGVEITRKLYRIWQRIEDYYPKEYQTPKDTGGFLR